MVRSIVLAAVLLQLSGCGLGETAASAGAGGVSKAEELEQARQTQSRIEQQLDDAARQAAERRQAIDAME